MTDREPESATEADAPRRHNIADDVPRGQPAGGTGDDSPGMPGGTLGTGGAREEDQ